MVSPEVDNMLTITTSPKAALDLRVLIPPPQGAKDHPDSKVNSAARQGF